MKPHFRFIRRYESWSTGCAGGSGSGWQYYTQEQRPRFWVFGKPVWRDVAGPFNSKEAMMRVLQAGIDEQNMLGKEEVLP